MKPKTLKPRRMTAMIDPHFRILGEGEKPLKKRSPHDTIPTYVPVLVIPLTRACLIPLVYKAAKAHGHDPKSQHPADSLILDNTCRSLMDIGLMPADYRKPRKRP